MNRTKILFLKIAYVFFWVAAAYVVWQTGYVKGKSLLYQIGQILAICALSGLSLQFLLSSRLPILEKGVGHDRLMRWHHFNGKLITLFVLLHPLLNYFMPMLRRFTPLEVAQRMTLNHWYGEVAVSLILATVVIAIYFKRLRLKYETWRWVHRIVYAVIVLGFLHSFNLGSDLYSGTLAYMWWWGLLVLVVVAASYRLVGRLIWRRRWYRISETIQENYNVTTLRMMPEKGGKLAHRAGQFAFITLHSDGLPVQEHPFTIAAAPEDPYLGFSIKGSGDFTKELSKVKAGDRVAVEAPYGAFTRETTPGPLVFIAGGIGVTPFMSMLRSMAARTISQPVLLLWANQTEKDIVFKAELDVLDSTHDWLTVIHVLAEQAEGYENGRIDADKLKKYVVDFSRKTFFICGPPPMMAAIEKTLSGFGVRQDQIITEKFSLN